MRLYYTGSERELKREVLCFNEKAHHFDAKQSLKGPRKRKANLKYVDDENKDNESIATNSQPSKSKKKKCKTGNISHITGLIITITNLFPRKICCINCSILL